MSDDVFLDLDRVEVLKGPQSTFFGNNAIAGALNIVTRNRPMPSMHPPARSMDPTANTPSNRPSADR